MLERIKLALRYNNSIFDKEIIGYIEACKKNLILAGVNEDKIVETDESIITTIVAYCKWQLNFQSRGVEWEKIYNNLKLSLTLDSRYK